MDSKITLISRYIEDYWDNTLVPAKSHSIRSKNPFIQIGRIPLPDSFVAPNQTYFAGTQFYWDTYFTILGLIDSGRAGIAKDMVNNLCFLQQIFGLIPARNSWTCIGRTQPPYLTRMAYEIYDVKAVDSSWMNSVMDAAQNEYNNVWTCGKRIDDATGMSCYNPKYFSKHLAVFESGWDKSQRFEGVGTDLLPVDLNCLLYQYESDFLAWATEKQDVVSQLKWKAALADRKVKIEQYFWNNQDGFYYDRSSRSGEMLKLKTLAGFYPLWCGAASKLQAKRCRENLVYFEVAGGLTTTEKLPYKNNQWDYPNGWAPLQWIVIEGLKRYGYVQDANRIARKWLDCNVVVFNDTGLLWEKYDVVKRGVGLPGRYATQPGFAWTNSIFTRLVKDYKINF